MIFVAFFLLGAAVALFFIGVWKLVTTGIPALRAGYRGNRLVKQGIQADAVCIGHQLNPKFRRVYFQLTLQDGRTIDVNERFFWNAPEVGEVRTLLYDPANPTTIVMGTREKVADGKSLMGGWIVAGGLMLLIVCSCSLPYVANWLLKITE